MNNYKLAIFTFYKLETIIIWNKSFISLLQVTHHLKILLIFLFWVSVYILIIKGIFFSFFPGI